MRTVARGVIALLVLVGGLAGYQAVSLRSDFQKFPPPGKLVDVSGTRLHIDCAGPVIDGAPTVVFESGLGAGSIPWRMVQRGISERARACGIDRAGYGWSDPGPEPRTARQMVGELHTLLENAGEKAPYVLVGHSFGSVVIRLYAAMYPDEVAGLVMLDPRHEDFFERMPPEFLRVDEANLRSAQMLSIATPLGITRMAGEQGLLDSYFSYLDPLPDQDRAAARAVMFYNPHHWGTALAERAAIKDSLDQVRETMLSRDLPLIVLTGERGADAWQPEGTVLSQSTRDLWMALQEEQAGLTDQGEWIVVEGSGHYIHIDRPDAVVAAIVGMIDAGR